ncbi:hypothetical protein AWM75_08455 [Aerococcus urinaehominis]|uniref:Uncharacterized protein n=1 Tax=Aerococcus urinaehominis TaxID=128944 RepID=A0A109RIC2_9LACT|nr:NAD(P)-dependent oxidoreductase [Aerococcus urinaehominis]AMC00001.1 hypothetical protein AWM75_08455 [Aerococcus urinaehominis]SDL82411.1 D-3-phosphoglycerate dehydrogenase [Aerococcus urinaehominis]
MKVLVQGSIPADHLKSLSEHFTVDFSQADWSDQDLLDKLANYEAVLVRSGAFGPDKIDAGKKLKIIANFGAGYDAIDADYARQKGILVTNTPQAVRTPTAETTLLIMLGAIRHYDHFRGMIHAGQWPDQTQPENLTQSLLGAKVGIVGFGSIGQEVARLLQPFNVQLSYYQRHESPQAADYQAQYMSFDDLLAHNDVITVHVPLTDETHHMFDQAAFEKMQPSAYFINMARGPVHDEAALIKALESGQIAGAGLDVFEEEPKISPELLTMDQVFTMPHLGTATHPARRAMAEEASQCIISFLVEGEEMYRVN